MSVDWDSLYAERLQGMTTSVIRDILKVAQAPDIISMAGGWPEAALFPVNQFREVAEYALTEQPEASLQYGLTDGYRPLREEIAAMYRQRGVPITVENVAITSGSQQALDLAARVFIDKGDPVLVEEPSFIGALQSFTGFQCRYLTVPLDDEGVSLEGFRKACAQKPKYAYLLPTFQNPTGVTMSLARRQQIVDLAAEAGICILEDDPYGQLRFEGDHLPSLLALNAQQYPENGALGSYIRGDVIHLGTFSKTLAPGLRLAWAISTPEIIGKLVMAKQGADLHTNALAQTMACEFVRRGWLPAQIARIRETYRVRAAAMQEAIAEFFPAGVQTTHPQGGLFLWVTLPEGMNAVELLPEAAAHKVAFVPGAPFFANGGGENCLRLAYATMEPEVIREGVRRLGEVIKVHMG